VATKAPQKGVIRPLAPPPHKGIIRPLTAVPGGVAAPSGGTPTPAPFTPDAQYLASAAQAAFQRHQQIEQLNQEGANDKTNLTTAINRLLGDVPKARQGINEGANKEGLFYSGQLTKRLNDYEQQVQRAQDDLNTGFGQRDQARQAAITALQQGAPLDNQQLLAEAAGRQIGTDTTAADAGALAPPASSAPAPAAAPTLALTAAQKLIQGRGNVTKTIPAPGGVIHVHANGQRIFVPTRR
jgi:hypothetical protein